MPAALNLIGDRYGKLVVIKKDSIKQLGRKVRWICECDCGSIVSIIADNLRSGNSTSCTNCIVRIDDLTGKKFSKLTVVKRGINKYQKRDAYWDCVCDCGGTRTVRAGDLKNGTTTCCGCNLHHMSETSEFKTWMAIRQRCNNINNNAYKYYGGRGIKICDRWLESFNNFYDDMGPKPGPDYSIDRTDNNGNYEPENCKWIPRCDQSYNRRSVVLNHEKAEEIRQLHKNGESVSDLSEDFNCGKDNIRYVLKNKSWNRPKKS